MKPKINIITLAVNDLERSIAFYEEGLGLPTEGLEEGADHIIFDMEDGISLVLFLRSELEELNTSRSLNLGSKVILSHTAENKEEVDFILQRAVEFGGELLPLQPKEYDWGYSGHFKDLDGHIWEIVSFN